MQRAAGSTGLSDLLWSHTLCSQPAKVLLFSTSRLSLFPRHSSLLIRGIWQTKELAVLGAGSGAQWAAADKDVSVEMVSSEERQRERIKHLLLEWLHHQVTFVSQLRAGSAVPQCRLLALRYLDSAAGATAKGREPCHPSTHLPQ